MKHRSIYIRGFTLAEILVGSTLAAIVMLAVLSSYLYLGRNLTRLGNLQVVETQARRAAAYLNRDIQAATFLSSPLDRSLTLKTSSGTVTYTYILDDKTLTRNANFGAFTGAYKLFEGNCTDFEFGYYSSSGSILNSSTVMLTPTSVSVKQISFRFTLEKGGGAQLDGNGDPVSDGTLVQYKTQSARVILHNKWYPDGT